MPSKQRKIALMGYRSVGKSSLAIQFVQGQFVDHYEPTIENTFNKKLSMRGNEYELFLVDTAGQDEYSIFPPEHSVDIHAYILVYSIDSAKSFEVCKIIHEKLHDIIGIRSVPMVLVGNKTDLHMDRRVTVEEGKALAEEMKAVFLETSAKENRNVADVFTKLVSEMEKIDGDLPDDKKCVIS
jgi:Ras family protein